jgi:hypothetical protein
MPPVTCHALHDDETGQPACPHPVTGWVRYPGDTPDTPPVHYCELHMRRVVAAFDVTDFRFRPVQVTA